MDLRPRPGYLVPVHILPIHDNRATTGDQFFQLEPLPHCDLGPKAPDFVGECLAEGGGATHNVNGGDFGWGWRWEGLGYRA